MDKKSNMKQAVFEMFGVGSDQNAKVEEPVKEEAKPKTTEKPAKEKAKSQANVQPQKEVAEKTSPVSGGEKPVASFLAPGTVLEGTLRSAGDVEIAGNFKGEISAEGKVVLRSDIHGNVSAHSLDLNGCKLEGDVIVKELVFISQDSVITGNVTADELKCSGQISGDLKIKNNTLLESTSKITGNVTTGTIAVMKGAVINGGVDIKLSGASEEK